MLEHIYTYYGEAVRVFMVRLYVRHCNVVYLAVLHIDVTGDGWVGRFSRTLRA